MTKQKILYVSCDHVAPEYRLNDEPFYIGNSVRDMAGVGHFEARPEHGIKEEWYADCNPFGCGKSSYVSPQLAIRLLLNDNGCTNIRIYEESPRKQFIAQSLRNLVDNMIERMIDHDENEALSFIRQQLDGDYRAVMSDMPIDIIATDEFGNSAQMPLSKLLSMHGDSFDESEQEDIREALEADDTRILAIGSWTIRKA